VAFTSQNRIVDLHVHDLPNELSVQTKLISSFLVPYSNCKRERKKGTGSVANPTENLAKRQVTVPCPFLAAHDQHGWPVG
jgi:hypothetical protein